VLPPGHGARATDHGLQTAEDAGDAEELIQT